jgi:hypothetical protein
MLRIGIEEEGIRRISKYLTKYSRVGIVDIFDDGSSQVYYFSDGKVWVGLDEGKSGIINGVHLVFFADGTPTIDFSKPLEGQNQDYSYTNAISEYFSSTIGVQKNDRTVPNANDSTWIHTLENYLPEINEYIQRNAPAQEESIQEEYFVYPGSVRF